LEVVLARENASSSRTAPKIQLWDWSDSIWVTLDHADWGRIAVSEPLNYIGPGNAVRIRLQNDSSTTVEIQDIYPLITGDF
jgi:hypothetical protein